MTSAAVLFYGRSRRHRSSRSFNDLGFGSAAYSPFTSSFSSSSSSSSSSLSSDLSNSSSRRNRHRRGDNHRRQRHISFDNLDQSRQSSNIQRSPISGSESHQQVCNVESSSQDINSRETVNGLSGRYQRNNSNSLPGSVLLARERLVQRLRGVSVSETRDSRETSPRRPSNHSWVVDADWETGGSREEPASYTIVTELPVGAHQSAQREPQTKPLGLTSEALSELNHEVFVVQQNPMSRASNECSICLESFVEGNNLINLPCGHRFHSSCLYPWLQTCGECPYCRSCIMFFS